ncbi:MAG: TldD/PmbA family protein [Methanomicrobiales archaeon]|nr:TldD/PmbA family protein [Methanomicrobiales archaeon]
MSEERALIEELLGEASRLADEAEVFIISGESLSLVQKGESCETAEASCTWGMGIRVIRQGRIGASSTGDPKRWKDCLIAALESSRLSSPQNWGGLPSPIHIEPRAETADPAFILSPLTAARLLREVGKGVARHRSRIAEASVELEESTVTLANTHGLEYTAPHTAATVSCETIVENSTAFEFDQSVHLDLDAARVGEKASFLAEYSLNAVEIPTGNYDVVLSPIAASHLLGGVLVGALSGKNVHAGRSALASLMGKECMSPLLDIYDDPFAKGMGSTDWDAEGVPTKRLDFVCDGVLGAFAYDLRTAYRYGEESTGSAVRAGHAVAPVIGVHNLVFDGERSDVKEERALYVHDVVGAHTANPLSGDLSVELSKAFWIEDGESGTPVRSGMLVGNVFDLLKSVEGLGKESRVVGNAILPELRLSSQRIIGI